jgi:hypothetical protein
MCANVPVAGPRTNLSATLSNFLSSPIITFYLSRGTGIGSGQADE